MTGQRYTPEFKDEAVKQVIDRGYTIAELLAASDYSQPQPSEEREWVDAPGVGNELL